MEKQQLSLLIKEWLEKFLIANYSDSMVIVEIIIPETSLSKLPNAHIKSMANRASWEFKPDLVGILQDKKTGKIKLAIVNRTTSSISLKEIGELHIYAKVLDAEVAILISTNGPSNEVNILLVDQSIRQRLLNYSQSSSILIATWDEDNREISRNSILPIENRDKYIL